MTATSIRNPAEFGSFELHLDGGRRIWLADLRQHRTYGGMLCGYPVQHVNENTLAEDRARAAQRLGVEFKPLVLTPEIRAYDYPPQARRRSGPCVALPPITTYAVFDSTPTARDGGCNSSLLLVWYQDTWGLPDEAVRAQIAAIDWDAHATDWMW